MHWQLPGPPNIATLKRTIISVFKAAVEQAATTSHFLCAQLTLEPELFIHAGDVIDSLRHSCGELLDDIFDDTTEPLILPPPRELPMPPASVSIPTSSADSDATLHGAPFSARTPSSTPIPSTSQLTKLSPCDTTSPEESVSDPLSLAGSFLCSRYR